MNAPFHPRGSALRDPFTAYVCDDATAELLKIVVAELGWAPEKVHEAGGLGEIVWVDDPAFAHIDREDVKARAKAQRKAT